MNPEPMIGEKSVALAICVAEACASPERFPCDHCEKSDGCVSAARAAISAHLAALERAGWMPAEEFLECAQYDALMEGPRFKGWDRSALDRLRQKYEAIVLAAPPPQNSDEVKP